MNKGILMNTNNKKKVIGVFLFLILSVLVMMLLGTNCPIEYINQFFCLTCCHVFLCICLIIDVTREDFYIFEPIVFVTFLYWMIFVFTPIYNIFTDNLEVFGVNTMSGCIKGTLVFAIGYIALRIGYHYKFILHTDAKKHFSNTVFARIYKKKGLLKYSYIVWSITVGLYLLYNAMIGRNPLYMLSFGILNRGLEESSGFSVDFLSMVIYMSFVPMLNILINEKSKILKFIIFYVTCVPIATRGFRSAVVVPLAAPFIYYYLKKKKSPRLRTIILAFLIFLLLFGLIGSARGGLRTGTGANLENYTYSDGTEGMLDYFGSYKVYYGAVINYPSNYNYTYGRQLLYTITMYIPRLLWPEKPLPLIYQTITNSINSSASKSGSAWPNIGEYYTDGGIIGVVVAMLILGIMLRRMKLLYLRPSGSSLCTYSALLPALVMIIAYGYTAGNLPGIIFIALPYWMEKYFVPIEFDEKDEGTEYEKCG